MKAVVSLTSRFFLILMVVRQQTQKLETGSLRQYVLLDVIETVEETQRQAYA